MKPKVFITREIPAPVLAFLREHTELTLNPDDRVLSAAEVIAGARGCEALLCNITDPVGAEIMDALPGLRVIANFGVGFNNIDVAAATARKIPVTNTPGVLTEATADIAFALLLASARRLGEGERLVRSRAWTGWNPMQMLGADVTGATLGLIGFGRIGQAMAKRARAFDLTVIYWNRTRLSPAEEQALQVTYRPFDDVVAAADFLSLHVAYNKDTHHLIGEKHFAAMKPTAIVINTARGPVLDEKALVRALSAKRIGGAGLDVFEREPVLEPELYTLPNAVVVPHLGSATIGTRTKMGMLAAKNLLAVCAGQRPPNCVNPQIYG
ncbi:2-hydroxyacid dehydrogenase [Horticoccus sp. 23ND18S-11]|uniref:2-hydroxyacid dehydrogenase n=1 Tax=Horticoccus sp. 23ND18S-11 TaxID=3391832 RepID=UPI0039C9EB34